MTEVFSTELWDDAWSWPAKTFVIESLTKLRDKIFPEPPASEKAEETVPKQSEFEANKSNSMCNNMTT